MKAFLVYRLLRDRHRWLVLATLPYEEMEEEGKAK